MFNRPSRRNGAASGNAQGSGRIAYQTPVSAKSDRLVLAEQRHDPPDQTHRFTSKEPNGISSASGRMLFKTHLAERVLANYHDSSAESNIPQIFRNRLRIDSDSQVKIERDEIRF
jgi:hypothetical protein